MSKASFSPSALDDRSRDWAPGTTYADVFASLLPSGPGPLASRVAEAAGLDPDHDVLARLEWAGLLSARTIPEGSSSPLDILVHRMTQRMLYGPGERDMIVLRHEFVAEWAGRPAEKIVSLLTSFGDPGGETAMARTVSLPAAVAIRLLAEGDLDLTGVHVPVLPDLYVPVLEELAEMGVKFQEWSQNILPGPLGPDSAD